MKTPMLKFPLCALAFCVALTPAVTLAQDTGAAAYEAGEYTTAQERWTTEAESGSIEAMLGLARLADSGLLGEADPAAAFDWYLKAAELGDAEAQLNVALGYDTGLGVERDETEAMLWYGRAALRGVTDAQLGLASLFETGTVTNPALANYWFAQAGADHKVDADAEAPLLAAPEVLFDDVHENGAELVWRAPAAQSDTYRFEVIDAAVDDGYADPVTTEQTDASVLLIDDAALPKAAIWRVMNLGDAQADYRATAWKSVGGAEPPAGRVTLTIDETVAAMAKAAEVFAADLRAAGYWVRVVGAVEEGASVGLGTHVTYAYQSDLALADKVARYLPGPPDGVGFVQRPGTTEPGEIIVHLAAGE